ncbi:hypothetical protein J1605_004386 [Eschrichtius robustus]|uniref:Uncharacterized protein n=1 Tax=Eschrichtius robustus TaxID=9764 RepID=A0AB34GHL6_ESCRO|nr:hypothetical protein J1605_013843 [Eschrichtius robustus]KAJ8791339.1 hypothetical protein J1605_004386 [Eschrichtius robustus]
MMSIRSKLQNKEHVTEALLRAKFKFPGRQKIHISKKGGFTKFNEDEFESMVAEKRPIPDGCRSEEALCDKATGWSEVWRLGPISPVLPDPSVFPPILGSEAEAEAETETEAEAGLLSDQSSQQGDSLQKSSEVAQENMGKAYVNRLNLRMLWNKLPREVTQ